MKVCEQASDLEVAGLPLPWWGTTPPSWSGLWWAGEKDISQSLGV